MKLLDINERPSAPLAGGRAPARAHCVGYLTVHGVPAGWQSTWGQSVAFIEQLTQQKSVQLQEPRVRVQGTNGLTATKSGMANHPFAGIDASGVPPRGRPV
jgi:hypothetical protein